MNLIIGIAMCLAIFFAVVAFYARVLYLMGCCAGDLMEDEEPELASVESAEAAQITPVEESSSCETTQAM